MAKKEGKPLLNEGTIRRFMKLAEIGGLSDNFVGDLYEEEEELQEALPPEDEMGAEDDLALDAAADPEAEMEPPMEEEPPMEDPEAEMAPAPPEGGMGEDELNQFVEDVIAGVAQAAADLGVDVDVEGAAGRAEGGLEGDELGGLGDELGGLGDEAALEEPPPEEELGGLEGGEDLGAAPEEEEEPLAEVVDDETLVNEIAKRVAARLIRASRAAKK